MSFVDQNGFPKLNAPFVEENRQISIPWYRLLITLWNRSGGAAGGGSVPSGAIMDWGGAAGTVPNGWLLCNGLVISRSANAALFAAIGTTWGAGDGVSTFALPNLVGKYRKGTAGVPPAGTLGGAGSIVLTSGQLPPHSHTVNDPGHFHGITDPGHAHMQQVVNAGAAGVAGSWGANVANTTPVGVTVAATTGITINPAITGITIGLTGSGDPIDINPPNASLLVIIKT